MRIVPIIISITMCGCATVASAPKTDYVPLSRYDSLLKIVGALNSRVSKIKYDTLYLKKGTGGFDGKGTKSDPYKLYVTPKKATINEKVEAQKGRSIFQ